MKIGMLLAPLIMSMWAVTSNFVQSSRQEERSSLMGSVTAAGVPVVVRFPADTTGSAPLIVLWHGFGPPASKEALAEALPLAHVNAYKAYLDLPLFGERLPEGGGEEIGKRQREDYVLQLFAPVTQGAVGELRSVVDELRRKFRMDIEKGIGLFGFSAGGAAALFALAEGDVPVRAGVVLNAPHNLESAVGLVERVTGMPYAWNDEARAAARQSDFVRRTPDLARGSSPAALLLLHSADDEYFATDGTRTLYEALRPHYRRIGRDEELDFRILSGLGHHIGARAGTLGPLRIWPAAPVEDAAAAWFERHLTAQAASAR